jgi:hypothetical protein
MKKLTAVAVKAYDDLGWELDAEARRHQEVADYFREHGLHDDADEAAAKANARWIAAELIEKFTKENS